MSCRCSRALAGPSPRLRWVRVVSARHSYLVGRLSALPAAPCALLTASKAAGKHRPLLWWGQKGRPPSTSSCVLCLQAKVKQQVHVVATSPGDHFTQARTAGNLKIFTEGDMTGEHRAGAGCKQRMHALGMHAWTKPNALCGWQPHKL